MPRGRPKKVVEALPTTPKTTGTLPDQLAALLYYREHPKEAGSFEHLTDEQTRDRFLIDAAACLDALEKLGYVVLPTPATPAKDRVQQIEELTFLLKEFVAKLQSLRPDHFPAEELAHQLVDR